MKKPPIGTPPKEASEKRLAEEQAKRLPLQTADSDRIEAAIAREKIGRLVQERDDAEARGEAMFEKLQPALTIAEAEIERLQTALRDICTAYCAEDYDYMFEIANTALSGKGES